MIFITNHLQDNQPRCGCAIIVSDLSLSLRDKERLRERDRESLPAPAHCEDISIWPSTPSTLKTLDAQVARAIWIKC